MRASGQRPRNAPKLVFDAEKAAQLSSSGGVRARRRKPPISFGFVEMHSVNRFRPFGRRLLKYSQEAACFRIHSVYPEDNAS
jgi:hypothetical protein